MIFRTSFSLALFLHLLLIASEYMCIPESCEKEAAPVFNVAVLLLILSIGELMLWFFAGKTYRLRVSNVGISTSLNFRIQNHNLLLAESEGSYTVQQNYTSLDIHVGQSYSFLVTMDQNASSDYYIVASAGLSTRPYGRESLVLASCITQIPKERHLVHFLPDHKTNLIRHIQWIRRDLLGIKQ